MTHQEFSAQCFNGAWDLIDLEERTPEQDDEMLALAMASYWHWTQREDFAPKNASISFWQIGRVHALRGEGVQAVHFGRRAVEVIDDPSGLEFFVAYGHEAQARGALLLGNGEEARRQLDQADRMLDAVDADTRAAIDSDLAELRGQLADG